MTLLKIRQLVFRIWPLAVIFLVAAVFFWKFILRGWLPIPSDTIVGMYHPWRDLYAKDYLQGIPFKNFLITDPVRQLYPWRQLAIDLLKNGELPNWNPYSFTGTPLLANFQSASFYFLNTLFLILDTNIAWGILILLQPLLAAGFLYFYLRQLKLSPISCLIGGLSFAFSGFFIAWLEWGTILHSALWLPLILLSIEKISIQLSKSKFSKWGIVFVFSLIQSFFAGHLQTFFYVFIFSFIYLIWKLLQVKTSKKKLVLLFTICYLLFIIITSVQWQPILQLIKLSAREVDQADWRQPGWFVPWKHLVQFFAPDFFGNPSTLNYWGEWNYGEFIGYIGVIPLIFVLYAIFFVRSKYFILYTLYFILFLSFALPTPWAKIPFQHHWPLVATSQPTRLLFLVDFCLAVLASLGIEQIFKKKLNYWPLIGFFVFYTGIWLVAYLGHLPVAQRNLILPTGMLLAGSFLLILISWKKIPKILIRGTLLILIIFDLLRFGGKFNPFVKKDWLFPTTKAIEFLKSDKDVFRIMAIDRRIFPPNFSVVYKLQDVAGYDPLYLLRYGELIAALERNEPNISPPFGFNRIITPQNYQSKLIDLLNVKYVLSLADLNSPRLNLVFREGETRVYQNSRFFPRAFLVYDYLVAENKQKTIEKLFDPKIDLTKTVVLEKEIDLVPSNQLAENQVKIVDYQSNLVKLEVISKQPGILVLTDAFYPGWQATIDPSKSSGQVETEIYRADYHFRAIIIPEGEHQVVFEYGG